MKRALSLVLAFIMVLSLVPTVYAAETALIQNNGLTVTHSETMFYDYNSEAMVSGPKNPIGSVQWESTGSQITAVAIPDSILQTAATLTFKNELSVPATLRFEYSLTNEDCFAEIWGVEGSPVEKELEPGESFTITVISPDPWETSDPAVLTISNISLSTGGDVTATFAPAANGSYTVNGEPITAETAYTAATGTAYALSATAASGYRFFGWYNGTEYLSYNAQASVSVSQNETIQPVFIKDTVAVFGVGAQRFQSLSEADAYAKNGAVKTIILMNDGILTGEHTVSAGNTLLIPYDAAGTVHTEATSIAEQISESLWENKEWEEPRAYRTLTMAQGAKLTVQGSLNVGGKHSSGPFLTAGSPSGDLGMIQMAEGSNITVADGGVVYCWGYIYGDGTVTVKDGGTVHENFQFTDFRGGNATLAIAQTFMVFPISQYYVQNIEVAATFEHGATEHVWGSIYLQSQVRGTSVKFIGEDANLCMFVPGEGGTVTKTYHPETDRLHIDIEGDGSINPMALELGGFAINTETFVLPINSNMTINVNSGTTALDQSLALLPGVELTIAKDATLSVKSGEPLKDNDGNYVHYTGGNNLIVYDRDQWLNAYSPVIINGNVVGANPITAYFVFSGKRLQPLAYSPTCSYTRTEANLQDAVLDINGKLITEGFVYTTVDIDLVDYFYYSKLTITGGGAAVTSSEGTGKLIMNNGAGMDFITLQPVQNSDQAEFAYLPMVSARLMNEDGSYLDTYTSAKGAAYNFCGECGKWYAGDRSAHTVEINWIVDGKDGIQEVCLGAQPLYNDGNDPVKDGYTFTGWSTANDNEPEYTSETLPAANADAVYYACFQQNAATGMLGDFDDDGEITAEDLTLLARHVAGIEMLTGQALENADVDGSGEIDANDLTKHARYVAGIITDWNQE